MFYLWLLIIVLLAVIEVMTVNLTTIWFVISGLLSLIISFLIDNFLLELSIFVIGGIVLLMTTRPFLTKFLKKSNVQTNADRIIGMKGIVTEEISINKTGEVKVDGKRWTAFSDSELKIDSIVRILEIDGVKLKVEKWED